MIGRITRRLVTVVPSSSSSFAQKAIMSSSYSTTATASISKLMNQDQYQQLLRQATTEVDSALHAHNEAQQPHFHRINLLDSNQLSSLTGKDLRSYLNDMLTTAPVDFPIELNAKLGKLLEYEARDDKITNWHDIPKASSKWNVGVWKGDISTLKIDAIVNAANKYLLGCFTPNHKCIDNVIHCRAGPLLREECRRLVARMGERETTGKARLTLGYNLPAKHVIHTVGPVIREGEAEKPDKLASCYRECLDLAKRSGLRSIAFCCISTGVFGYPKESAAHVALKTTKEWLEEGDNSQHMDLVLFNVFMEEDNKIYNKLMPAYFPEE